MKLKTRIFFFTITLIILSSCASKILYTENKEDIKKDSISITRDRIIVEKVTDTIRIESPCDSLGNLKPFKYSLVVPQGKVSFFNVGNDIMQTINLKGYEKMLEIRYQKMYEKKISEIKQKKIIYKTPLWMWLTIIFETLIIILLIKSKLPF
jgi:hypothetical protein